MYLKYIRHKDLGFIIFEKNTDHKSMSEWLGGAERIQSAGQIFIGNPETLKCKGESTTLLLSADDNDSRDLQRLFE